MGCRQSCKRGFDSGPWSRSWGLDWSDKAWLITDKTSPRFNYLMSDTPSGQQMHRALSSFKQGAAGHKGLQKRPIIQGHSWSVERSTGDRGWVGHSDWHHGDRLLKSGGGVGDHSVSHVRKTPLARLCQATELASQLAAGNPGQAGLFQATTHYYPGLLHAVLYA